MKIRIMLIAAIAASFSAGSLMAADAEQMAQYQADCKKYAAEDGVAPEEMDAYLSQCIQDMAGEQGDGGSEGKPASD
jgi:hypothetical protein